MQQQRNFGGYWVIPILASVVLGVPACGQPESVEEVATQQSQQMPGFGPVTIRIMGTAPKPASGTVYPGDCSDTMPDDDLEVMTFSAPWKVVGDGSVGGGGAGARFGSPVTRTFNFEKSPDVPKKQLQLHFGLEQTTRTVADLTAGLAKIADIEFGNSTVGLYYVEETKDLLMGYAALFPIAQTEGMPNEAEFTGRYIATVGFNPVGASHFDGWSEAEIIQLFNSFSTARCLGEGLEQGLAPFSPTVVYE